MSTIITGIFFILHGMVHLLYFGHSQRRFELRPGMNWPDNSWAFSRLLGEETTRLLASVSLAVVALGFIAAGLGLLTNQDWWRTIAAAAALLSSVLFILFWDGKLQALDEKGAVALLINVVILVALLVLR
jgi:hypothetical protein